MNAELRHRNQKGETKQLKTVIHVLKGKNSNLTQ